MPDLTLRKIENKLPHEMAVDLIKYSGVGGIGYFDGCNCCDFKIFNVFVDISCRKSSGSCGFRGTVIKVSSKSMDYDKDDLLQVGNAVCDDLYNGSTSLRLIIISGADKTIIDRVPNA